MTGRNLVDVEEIPLGSKVLIQGQEVVVEKVTPMTEGEIRLSLRGNGLFYCRRFTKLEVVVEPK